MDKLTFRRVRMSDLWTLYAWRMEQQTAFWSLDQPPPIDRHAEWMKWAIANEDVYIAENGSVGTVAVMQVIDGEVGITVNPLARSRGYGKLCIGFLQRQYDRLRATVVVGNTHSLHLFTSCKFELMDAHIIKHRPCVILEWRK
jgi:RimJ/RimL family protein N-acetyltransferase